MLVFLLLVGGKIMSDSDVVKKSEFGKGLTYCLGLFLAHAERSYTLDKPSLWFNAASDHLYELNTTTGNKEIDERLESLKSKSLLWGHGFDRKNFATEKDVVWAIEEAKSLLLEIDKTIIKIEVGEAYYS